MLVLVFTKNLCVIEITQQNTSFIHTVLESLYFVYISILDTVKYSHELAVVERHWTTCTHSIPRSYFRDKVRDCIYLGRGLVLRRWTIYTSVVA